MAVLTQEARAQRLVAWPSWQGHTLAQGWAGRQGTTLGKPASWTCFTKGTLRQGQLWSSASVPQHQEPCGGHGYCQLPALGTVTCPAQVPLHGWSWCSFQGFGCGHAG